MTLLGLMGLVMALFAFLVTGAEVWYEASWNQPEESVAVSTIDNQVHIRYRCPGVELEFRCSETGDELLLSYEGPEEFEVRIPGVIRAWLDARIDDSGKVP